MVVLPAPLGPKIAEDLPAVDLEVEPVDPEIFPVVFGEILGHDDALAHSQELCHGRAMGRKQRAPTPRLPQVAIISS